MALLSMAGTPWKGTYISAWPETWHLALNKHLITSPLKENGLEGRMDWIEAVAATQLLSVPVGGTNAVRVKVPRGILVTSATITLFLQEDNWSIHLTNA